VQIQEMDQPIGRTELHSTVFKRVWQILKDLVLSGQELFKSKL
jgi:hypothetical protein